MDDKRLTTILLIMAGIGAGVVAGAVIGMAISASRRSADNGMEESVDDLRGKAERVLHDLSDSISELRDKSQRLAEEFAGDAAG
jgi:hypothetical protein